VAGAVVCTRRLALCPSDLASPFSSTMVTLMTHRSCCDTCRQAGRQAGRQGVKKVRKGNVGRHCVATTIALHRQCTAA
jgi:hypothetical protein